MSARVLGNRTNVRHKLPVAVRAARAGLRVLSPASPALAATIAERLFLTATRHRRPAWERDALDGATPLRVPHEGSFLPAWRWGEGTKTIVLVHGWEGRGSQMSAFVAPLLERGFSVVTFDAPGHGDAPSRFGSVVEHARGLASVVRFVGDVHGIVAHSVGGAAALLALHLGDVAVDRLALVAPPVGPARFLAGFSRFLGLSPDVRRGVIARLERRYGIPYAELDARLGAAGVDVPLLVVHDEGDDVVPFEDGAAIAAAAKRGRVVSTRGLGHRRVLRAPEVIDAVVPFIAAGAPGEASAFARTIDGELFYRERRWAS
ncbi:MAG: alpha/beta hydrolase [Labilithrix sp.]|nr:alpha/beta hydrolase [Labilithrix sp.]